MTNNVAMLAEVPLFSLLDGEERSTLAELLTTVRVDKGDTIFAHGDPGNSLYIIRRGKVQIFMEDTRGQRIVLEESGPRDLFGEISLLDGGPRTAGAEAVEPTELLTLDREDLLEFITKRPQAALGLLTVMGQRLRSTNELLRMHASRNVNLEEEEQLTFGHRATDRVTEFVGSWAFVVLLIGLVVGALAAAPTASSASWTSPAPAILLLGLVVLGTFQATLILMSQVRQVAKDRLKADLDYEFNLKAELELARLNRNVEMLCEHVRDQRALVESGAGLAMANASRTASA